MSRNCRAYPGEITEEISSALKWIAAHQLPDGGWSFDHTAGPGDFRDSSDPGRADKARNAATSLALLPFLKAGQSHVEGEYKKVVEAGLTYLILNQKAKKNGGSFEEADGTMYSHGMSALVLCDAFAITDDRNLARPAQAAINYIVWCQDPIGGGWRYKPQEPGDTSVFAWQMSAIKRAHDGNLSVPRETVLNANKFINSVADDSGAFYGYTSPGRGPSTTAIGMLTFIYLGRDADSVKMKKGVEYLKSTGPSATDMYFNYFANQVLSKVADERTWGDWNQELRTLLIDAQGQTGNAKGSWYIDGVHSKQGGRLYITSLCTQILLQKRALLKND